MVNERLTVRLPFVGIKKELPSYFYNFINNIIIQLNTFFFS